ncbi:MAG: response regulator [Lachnospiraceae bacterium]|nr:response regulator [Lachnospiraceae bacterium]
MNRIRTDRYVISIITISTLAYIAESLLLKWEFWIPPLLLAGVVALWVMHITQRLDEKIREALYLSYGMMIVFFHGIHETSSFDVSLVAVLLLTLFSMMDHKWMMNLILGEYAVIMAMQVYMKHQSADNDFDTLTISRILLHLAIVLAIYFFCRITINNRLESAEKLNRNAEDIAAYDNDMEDFLSNISHELRTPVNVVNGMSLLMIKKGMGGEVRSINEAGLRLSSQIEDIQDYTEIKRGDVMLEEENYMSTSLINDVVAGFRLHERHKDLELVVDLDPRVPTMMKGDIKKLHKLFRHLLGNALKFTRQGGVCLRVYTTPREYGVNLCIEITDTGIGMSRKAMELVTGGMYQANRKRNRSTGGIGLGFPIIYGFAHRMGGFVKVESRQGVGTMVRVTIPQQVVDPTPCLQLTNTIRGDILFHVRSEKYKVPKVREFYRNMAINLADGLGAMLYSAESIADIESRLEKNAAAFIFMGQEEYEENPDYFDRLSEHGVVVAVSVQPDFVKRSGSRIKVMPKPLYGFPAVRILNEGMTAEDIEADENAKKPVFDGVRALIVDDEPMNLIVATGLFRDYKMLTDTAASGAESIEKFKSKDYDIIFMDHMMPEMDGVEAMQHLKELARKSGKTTPIVALTANVVSGAKEMFIREGFDGFIAKPIDIADFERVLKRVLPEELISYEDTKKGGKS